MDRKAEVDQSRTGSETSLRKPRKVKYLAFRRVGTPRAPVGPAGTLQKPLIFHFFGVVNFPCFVSPRPDDVNFVLFTAERIENGRLAHVEHDALPLARHLQGLLPLFRPGFRVFAVLLALRAMSAQPLRVHEHIPKT